MSFDLTDNVVLSELQRAQVLAAGLPKRPGGLDKSGKTLDTIRFPDYHEPLDRWPFLADPLLDKIRKHGRNPPLLTDTGRTKGVPNQRQILHTGPSDRIGTNLTPSAKHLRLKKIRDDRLRRGRLRKLMRDEGLLSPKVKAPEAPKSVPKKPLWTKFGKPVSRPPRRPRYY